MKNKSWLARAQAQWKFRGQTRPDFAIAPEPGQESVWDYPRPPKIVPDHREVTVHLGGVQIARTTRAIRILETASPPTFYLPPADVATDNLSQASGSSFCEWKGQATYWTVAIPGCSPQTQVGWSYENPAGEFAAIAGYLSFYPARLDCKVDGQEVLPQPGEFYGGWVTAEIVGPFKGEHGSGGW